MIRTAVVPGTRRELTLLGVGVLVGALLLGAALWAIAAVTSDRFDPKFEPVSGKVVILNPGETALCLKLEPDGERWCSGVYGDMSEVRVGDVVSGFKANMPNEDGSRAVEGFIYPSFDG